MGRGGAASLGTARPDATIATYTRRRRRPKAQRSLSGVAPTLQGVDVGAPHEPTAPPAVSAAADKKPSRKRRRNEAGKPVPEEWVRAKRAFFALVDDEPLESDKGRATTALRFESKPTPVKPLAPPSSHSRRESSDEYEVRSVARARCRALQGGRVHYCVVSASHLSLLSLRWPCNALAAAATEFGPSLGA